MKRLTLLLLALAGAQAGAQTIKPGLWELKHQLKADDPQTGAALSAAYEQLAKLPPEQRARIEAMVTQNGGTMPKIGRDGSTTLQACITEEMIAKRQLPLGQQGKCNSSAQPVSGGYNISFSCNEPPSSGQGQVRFSSDTAFTMHMNVSNNVTGTPQKMTVESSGHWVAASCPAAKAG
ncbi:DUF3617 domain-containing protein [Oxalobacteraceae bacterium A2-2]